MTSFFISHKHRSSLKAALLPIVFVLIFSVFGISTPAMAKTITQKPSAHLIIPSINVDARIRDMGLTPKGAMAVPNNRFDVGWYSLGTRPGETGSAVIGGHNFWNGAGVFQHLDQLKPGDVLSYVDAQGIATSFVVRETRLYNPTDDATDIFLSAGGAHLNLITCNGVFDPSTGTYTKRLVIFADLVVLQ